MRRLDPRIAGDIVENAVTLVDFCPGFLTFELKWQLLSLPGVHRCAVLHQRLFSRIERTPIRLKINLIASGYNHTTAALDVLSQELHLRTG